MSLGLMGRKIGMMRVFDDNGASHAVTVLHMDQNRVVQTRDLNEDSCAVQLTHGHRRASRVNKSLAGHCAKAGVEAGTIFREFTVKKADCEHLNIQPGAVISVESVLTDGEKIDVTAITQGKGFAGVIKRHHFKSNRASHGNSRSHNKPGSIGMNQDPGRVFKGKKMAGHMGAVQRTQQNLEIVRVDVDRQLVLVKGAVPGSKGADVIVKKAIKTSGEAK